MVVDKSSGILDYPTEVSAPMDADHNTICKFNNRFEPNYVLTVNLLRNLITDIERPQATGNIRAIGSYAEHSLEILRSIFGIYENVRETMENNLSRALEGSCQWLFDRASFRNWLDSPSSHRLLWLTGSPGVGKSLIATRAIEHIQQTLHCHYHFFIESQQEKQSTAYCLRAMAFQMAAAHKVLADRLLQLYKQDAFSVAARSFEDIWRDIFEGVIFKIDFGSTLHWVNDAVDEADNPSLLFRRLLGLKSKTSIKVLAFSRPQRELKSLTGFTSNVTVESISVENTLSDIQAYIRKGVTRILPDDTAKLEHVMTEISTRAEGSFLWTKLALDSLEDNWHIEADVEAILNKVPNDMQDLYTRMLGAIRTQPTRLQHVAFRVLAIAACSFRPLALSELVVALEPEFGKFLNLGETAVQTCGQFIRVDDGTITLIHATAREFLLNRLEDSTSSIGFTISHDYLAIACLQYLSKDHWKQTLGIIPEIGQTELPDRLEPVHDEYPFFEYSTKFWAYHVGLSGVDNADLVTALSLFCNRFILDWIQATALSNNLQDIPQAALYIRRWLWRRKKINPPHYSEAVQMERAGEDKIEFFKDWTKDLIRIVAKFGSYLSARPSSIQQHIPYFCPANSAIYQTYAWEKSPLISIQGLSKDGWDDNLARLSVGKEQIASAVRSAGNYFLALISQGGTVIIWHADTCEEARRICHKEWVTLMEINRPGSLAVTVGRFSTVVWDISTGQQLHSIPRRQARIIGISFGLIDDKFVLCHDDCVVTSHDLEQSTDAVLYDEGNQRFLKGCPRFMVLSPSHEKLAVGYPGRPLCIWNLAASPKPVCQTIIRALDKDLSKKSVEVFNPPEMMRWHPNGSTVFVLYHDAVILVWNLIDDTGEEFKDTRAREMIVSKDATYLITSDNQGSISIWSLPEFNLRYQLRTDEFVRDLALSPDGQRIYDVRGSGCNVWAPDALVRFHGLDADEKEAFMDHSIAMGHAPEPIIVEDKSRLARITALLCDHENEFYCCGKGDASVSIHEMKSGTRVRKVSNHASGMDVIVIGWSQSRRFLASADDSGRTIVKRLNIKEDGKWAVYPQFEMRTEGAVEEILFSLDDRFLLVSTNTKDQLWDLKKKEEICKKVSPHLMGRKWINHPGEYEHVVWLKPNRICIHKWATLELHQAISLQPSFIQKTLVSDTIPPIVLSAPSDQDGTLKSVVQPARLKFLLQEIKLRKKAEDSGDNGTRLDIIQIPEPKSGPNSSMKRKSDVELGAQIRHILGSYRNRLVFLDRDNWICTSIIDWEMGPLKRHFFIPGDWTSEAYLPLLQVDRYGTILSARNGEVAIIRYSPGL
jgi:WD40 repeat protein